MTGASDQAAGHWVTIPGASTAHIVSSALGPEGPADDSAPTGVTFCGKGGYLRSIDPPCTTRDLCPVCNAEKSRMLSLGSA